MRRFRHWLVQRFRGYRIEVPPTSDVHMRLVQAFAECPGQWVAVERSTGRVMAARSTPYELSAYVKGHGITGVEILRAPDVGEPEVVGIG